MFRYACKVLVAVLSCTLVQMSSVQAAEPETRIAYDGYKVVEVTPSSRVEATVLMRLGEMLNCRVGPGPLTLLVSPAEYRELDRLGIKHGVVEPDVGEHLEQRALERRVARRQRGGFFADYATFAEIEAFTDGLAAAAPNLVTKVTIGQSLEGRDITALRIKDPNAPADVCQLAVNGTQHAREWISPMANCFIADYLVNNHGSDPDVTALLENVEFIIIPVVNPDGYTYTHNVDRFWRKNRRNNGDGTFGVDLNRNWGYQWANGLPGSSSGSTSSETYRGTAPFSEPETTVVSDFLSTLSNLKGHIDVHTYSQLILGPWGYNDTIVPPRESELRAAQEEMAAAMFAVDGKTYLAGLGTDQLLYTADGIAPDWTFGVLDALSWTYEMRPDCCGLDGFDPPPSSILPGSQEALAGILVLADVIQRTVEFSFPGGLPSLAEPDTPTDVSTELILWNNSEVEPGTASLFSRIGSTGPFTETALSGGPASYTGQLPGAACGEVVEYYFQVETVAGETVTAPVDAPASLFSLEAAVTAVSFADDFESDTGWSVSGSVLDGPWERADPINNGRGDPPADFDGSGQCYVTDNQLDNGTNSDVDDGTTILTSPAFDATGGATISYAYWLDDGPGSIGPGDGLAVEVATDDPPTNWTQVRSYTTAQFAWRTDVIDVASEVGTPSATTRIRFLASDVPSGHVVECAIDAVEVSSVQSCPPGECEGDADGSGTVDVNDVSYVIFRLGDSGAPGSVDGDANGDGIVDVNDVSYVIFRLGPCPG